MEYEFIDIIACMPDEMRERFLIEASRSPKAGIRCEVAQCRYTSPEILGQLAYDTEVYVRWGVAENPNTLIRDIIYLSKDDDYGVRLGVVCNENTPIEIIKKLMADKEKEVYEMAREEFARRTKQEEVRYV